MMVLDFSFYLFVGIVISGAIWGGIILGFMEAIGLALLYEYGDITYLLIFVSLMIFLAIRPQGLMGKPWG